jgi:isopentenyldiphosphate isomerase
MSDELLDIVDENNVPIGKSALRSKIHSEGIWHRTVHIYLFRKNKNQVEFLVHLRSPFKDLKPNTWDTRFGGHIKSGLSIEEGARVELQEEIGLEIDINKLIEGGWRKRNKMPNREFSKVYYLEFNGDLRDLKFNDGEVQEVKWMSSDNIKNSIKNNPERCSGSLEGFMEILGYLRKIKSKDKLEKFC